MRKRNIAILVVALIVVVPLAVILILVATFNPNQYKPQIIAAVEHATHRRVSITGKLQLTASLAPTISASGITLANPPGYPGANMVTLGRIEARIALLPLLSHRIDVANLTLVDPTIMLERNAQGVGNWVFGQPGTSQPATAATPNRHVLEPGKRPAVALQAVSIKNGTLIIKQAKATRTVTIASLTAQAATLDAPLHLKAQAAYDGQPFTLDGTTGPLSRFSSGATGPWPIDATIAAAGATIHVKGTATHPRQLAGYNFAVIATAPDLAALDPYLDGYTLPSLKSVSFSGNVTQSNGTVPAVTDATLDAGASDLGTYRSGLALTALKATMKSLTDPLNLNATGSLGGTVLTLAGTMGPLGVLIPQPPPQPPKSGSALGTSAPAPRPNFAVDLTASAGDAQMTVKGSVAAPVKLAGVALKIAAQIPDLAHLSPLAGQPLPAWTHIDTDLTLTDLGGKGLRHAVGLESLAFSSDQAQIGGAASITLDNTPNLQAILNAPRIDLSALLAAMPKPANPTAGQPASPPASGAKPSPKPAPSPASGQLIPDTPLPFGLLRQAAGNVELSIDQLIYKNATYHAIQAHGLLQNGVLTVRPATADLPGGSVAATLEVNAATAPPHVTFTAAAPAFGLAPLLASFGLPHSAAGTVQLYADLAGQGQTPHAIAASLNGQLGVSLVNGEVDGAVIDHLFGDALSAAGLPRSMLSAQGPVLVRCFAVLVDANNGVGTLRAFTLDSSRVYLTGTGTLNLGPETLNVILRPQVQIGNGGVPVPVQISGTFNQPRPGVAPPGDYGATAEAIGQHFAGKGGSILGNLARRLGIAPPPPDPQSCTGALTLARMGHPGPAPAPAPAAMPTQASPGANSPPNPSGSGPQDLLRSLFR